MLVTISHSCFGQVFRSYYVAAKATYIRLLHGKIGFLGRPERAYNFWKTRPPPKKKICDGQKNVQISARFLTTFHFDRKYFRNGSTYRTFEKNLGEKNLVNFGPQTKKFCWLILTNQRTYFYGDYISAIRGCCALKIFNILKIDQGYLAHTQAGTRVPPKKILIAKI